MLISNITNPLITSVSPYFDSHPPCDASENDVTVASDPGSDGQNVIRDFSLRNLFRELLTSRMCDRCSLPNCFFISKALNVDLGNVPIPKYVNVAVNARYGDFSLAVPQRLALFLLVLEIYTGLSGSTLSSKRRKIPPYLHSRIFHPLNLICEDMIPFKY